MKKMTLDVKGMHCHSCEMLVQDSLSEIEGVKSVSASHKDSKVVVEYDGNIDEDKVRKAIKAEGYEVH